MIDSVSILGRHLFTPYYERGEESYEEDDAGAEDDGEVGMQVNAWQIPHLGEAYPCNDEDAAETSAEGCKAVDPGGNAA